MLFNKKSCPQIMFESNLRDSLLTYEDYFGCLIKRNRQLGCTLFLHQVTIEEFLNGSIQIKLILHIGETMTFIRF